MPELDRLLKKAERLFQYIENSNVIIYFL